MYRSGVLNSDINRVLGDLGHTDTLCISDCGLPVPDGVEKIDLAVKKDLPGFWDVFESVAGSMGVEQVTLSEEMIRSNPELLARLQSYYGESVKFVFVPHEEFKKQTRGCKAVIRTGEMTAYANVILRAACLF